MPEESNLLLTQAEDGLAVQDRCFHLQLSKPLDRQIEHPNITTLVPIPGPTSFATAHHLITDRKIGFKGFLFVLVLVSWFFFGFQLTQINLGQKKVPHLPSRSWSTPKKYLPRRHFGLRNQYCLSSTSVRALITKGKIPHKPVAEVILSSSVSTPSRSCKCRLENCQEKQITQNLCNLSSG